MVVAVWWVLLSCIYYSASGGGIKWNEFKEKLEGSNSDKVARKIANKWDERPIDFFDGVGGQAWRRIIPYLSASQKVGINTREFDHMTPETSSIILFELKACPTFDITFWTEQRIRQISLECLYKILTETNTFVRLGKLWNHVDIQLIRQLANTKGSFWVKIDRTDFDLIEGGVLKAISSAPGLCSNLKIAFWTEEKFKHASATCLYDILAKTEPAVSLGSLWRHVNREMLEYCPLKVRSSWVNIDHGDFDFMQEGVLKIITSEPTVCSSIRVSFLTRERINYISWKCLRTILAEAKVPIKLGELWASISDSKIRDFNISEVFLIESIAGSDFQYMPP